MSHRGSTVVLSRGDMNITIVVEGPRLEYVFADGKKLLDDFVFGPLRWSDVRSVELAVESNTLEVLRLDGGAEEFHTRFGHHLRVTGITAALPNVAIRLADQPWSWPAFWLGVGVVLSISLLGAWFGSRTVKEVALRGIR